MIHFENDYSEGACKEIMQRLFETNEEQTSGYGTDSYCEHAKELIRKACRNENIDVHFLVGGTQTNVTVISSILKSYQGVLCAETGHINVHETGAVEATGHKVLALTGEHGKITADEINKICQYLFWYCLVLKISIKPIIEIIVIGTPLV